MKPTCIWAVLLCLAIVAPGTSFAQILKVYSNPQGIAENCLEVTPGALMELYLVVTPVDPTSPPGGLSSVEFEDPTNAWQGSQIVPVWYTSPSPSAQLTTSPFGTIRVDFDECQPLPLHVATVHALVLQTPPPCRRLWVESVQMLDCNGGPSVQYAGQNYASAQLDTLCHLILPTERYPLNGATHVARDVVLTWGEMLGPHDCTGPDQFSIRLGKTPGTPLIWSGWDYSYHPPQLLDDNTTYYWSIICIRPGFGYEETQTWTFSTGEGPVAAQPSTWGRVKALYR